MSRFYASSTNLQPQERFAASMNDCMKMLYLAVSTVSNLVFKVGPKTKASCSIWHSLWLNQGKQQYLTFYVVKPRQTAVSNIFYGDTKANCIL